MFPQHQLVSKTAEEVHFGPRKEQKMHVYIYDPVIYPIILAKGGQVIRVYALFAGQRDFWGVADPLGEEIATSSLEGRVNGHLTKPECSF